MDCGGKMLTAIAWLLERGSALWMQGGISPASARPV